MQNRDSAYAHSALFYDHIPLYSERNDIEFYLDLAEKVEGAILELGSGTGRVLIPLLRGGYDVTGIDSSESMLDTCRRNLEQESKETKRRATLINADMVDFDMQRKFGLITIPFRAFQHLETLDEQLRCLRNVREHLCEGGIFLLDLFNPSMKFILDETRRSEFGDEPSFTLPDGSAVTRKFRNPAVDLAKQLIDCEIIYYVTSPDGKTERSVHFFRLRYLFRFEAENLLERSGFKVLEVLGDFDGNPFGTDWPGELILKATLK